VVLLVEVVVVKVGEVVSLVMEEGSEGETPETVGRETPEEEKREDAEEKGKVATEEEGKLWPPSAVEEEGEVAAVAEGTTPDKGKREL